MDEPITTSTDEELKFWGRHRFMLLIALTIVISIIMTMISIGIYNVSGSAQIDLSRPGYKSVSNQVETDNGITAFSSFGSVNKDTVTEFIKLYDEQAVKATSVDAFNGDPLNPEVLEFGTESTQ